MVSRLSELKSNPDNPRVITSEDFSKLKEKIKRVPVGLEVNRIAFDNGVVLAGNQRLRALKELEQEGMKIEFDKWFIDITNWTPEQKEEYIITSNISDGNWDWDILANTWDAEELEKLGFDTSELKVNSNLANIDDISTEWEDLDLLVVNPPEAPRLKERFELNFKDIDKYQQFKEKYFNDPEKLLEDLGL